MNHSSRMNQRGYAIARKRNTNSFVLSSQAALRDAMEECAIEEWRNAELHDCIINH